MKISQQAIEALKERHIRLQLAVELDFTELWIDKLIEANKPNGTLTTERALRGIEKITGLTREEILEEEVEKEMIVTERLK